jgi:hypothetical protein
VRENWHDGAEFVHDGRRRWRWGSCRGRRRLALQAAQGGYQGLNQLGVACSRGWRRSYWRAFGYWSGKESGPRFFLSTSFTGLTPSRSQRFPAAGKSITVGCSRIASCFPDDVGYHVIGVAQIAKATANLVQRDYAILALVQYFGQGSNAVRSGEQSAPLVHVLNHAFGRNSGLSEKATALNSGDSAHQVIAAQACYGLLE